MHAKLIGRPDNTKHVTKSWQPPLAPKMAAGLRPLLCCKPLAGHGAPELPLRLRGEKFFT